jgi:hypothetical protein
MGQLDVRAANLAMNDPMTRLPNDQIYEPTE